jgi:hypothetical protein
VHARTRIADVVAVAHAVPARATNMTVALTGATSSPDSARR